MSSPPPLTDRQVELLKDLYWISSRPDQASRSCGYCTPLDLGASDGSYHNRVLNQLANKGLCEAKKYGGWRGSKAYKITELGLEYMNQGVYD